MSRLCEKLSRPLQPAPTHNDPHNEGHGVFEQARPLRDGTLDPAEVKLVRVSVVQDDHQPRVLHGQAAFLLEASEGREILGILLDLLNFDLS